MRQRADACAAAIGRSDSFYLCSLDDQAPMTHRHLGNRRKTQAARTARRAVQAEKIGILRSDEKNSNGV